MKLLIKNVNLLKLNGDDKPMRNVNITIENGVIKNIGKIEENFIPDKIIDGRDKIAMPGLINSHTHIAMSLLRNYADDLPFWPWLTEKILPLEEKLKKADVYWGSALSIVEMIKSGITTFADMYFFMDETAKVVEKSGIRASLTRGITGNSSNDLSKIKESIEFYKNWNGKGDGRITVAAGPHAPYSCSPDYLLKVVEMAKEYNMRIHIHLSESKKEIEDSIKNYGKSPIKHVYDLGLFDVPTFAAHCVHVNDEDIEILSNNKVNVINNPGSNLKLANGFAPIDNMINMGVNVALGTDGSASNNNLNMFEEINLASIINKGITGDPTSVPAIKALQMATINGAKALGLDDKIGSLEVGRIADIILINLDKPHLYPRYNLVSALAYSAQASDVDTVIVNGNVLMENREILTLDEEEIMYNAEKHAQNLIK